MMGNLPLSRKGAREKWGTLATLFRRWSVIKFGEKVGLEVISAWKLLLPIEKKIAMDYDVKPTHCRIVSFERDAVHEADEEQAPGAVKDSAGLQAEGRAALETPPKPRKKKDLNKSRGE
jgi:hypothetical protein